jgi:hypothetical protein
MFQFLLASSQRLVFWASIKAPPPLEGASAIYETHSFLSLCELSPTPLCKVCVICGKFKFGLRESYLLAFEHLSFVKQIFVTFVSLGGEAS